MENIFGGLIEFKNRDEFDSFVNEIDKNSAIMVLESSINYCLINGVFNLIESNCLYKCLSKLKEYENNNLPDTDDIGGSDDSLRG